MKFKEIVTAFEIIEETSSRLSITSTLAALLKKTTPEEAQIVSYLVMGVLNPPYKGTQFAIAQKTMITIVARSLDFAEEKITEELTAVGDLGSVVAQAAWQAEDDVTLKEVYESLVGIEYLHGIGSQEKKIAAVTSLLQRIDPLSAKYIVRIILGTLRLGFSDMTLIDALSWSIEGDKSLKPFLEHAYNICADIGLIAYTLKKEGIEAIKKMTIHIGIPIRPAAAERLPSAQAIIEKIGPCIAQPKLDGFRLQVHIDNTQKEPLIKFFSRNLLDMSAMFPEFMEVCKKLPVTQLIADGEAIVYDPNTGTYVSFQETVKRRRKHGIEELVSELPMQLNLFDIMFLDGKSLLQAGQQDRRLLLQELFTNYLQQQQVVDKKVDKKNTKTSGQMTMFSQEIEEEKSHATETLQVIGELSLTTPEELEAYFIQEIAAGLEGLVIKKPDSLYEAGKRSFNWIKLKYQASEKLLDTLDVVILGYYPGRGKRARFGIGAFLVGVYNDKEDRYETVAKVGTGLTDEQWVDLKKRCDHIKVTQKPHHVVCAHELEPAVWVEPIMVCEVLADEITLSPVHTAGKTEKQLGYALRFPRFVQYRPDKDPQQATSIAELKTLQTRTLKQN